MCTLTPIRHVCKSSYYHLKGSCKIRNHLSKDTAVQVANALVSSRLDYCNSLFYGISKSNLGKLQRVQNALCRIVCRLGRQAHVTPHMRELHWLPVEHRIIFKLNCLTFKAIQFNQPTYLSTLIKSSTLTRGNRLSVSSFHPKRHVGFRSFEVASPLEWNRLPSDIRQQSDFKSFKSKLKTHLFRLAYPTLVRSLVQTLSGNDLAMGLQTFPFVLSSAP